MPNTNRKFIQQVAHQTSIVKEQSHGESAASLQQGRRKPKYVNNYLISSPVPEVTCDWAYEKGNN